MNKLKNPYSRNRMSFKEKFNKKFTDFIVPYIKEIPLDENLIVGARYIPEVLKAARISVKGWEREKTSTSEMPQGIDLDLISVVAAEYIPIENVNELNKGLKKLVEDYPYGFQHG